MFELTFDDVRGARPNAERDSFFTQCAFEVVPDGVVPIPKTSSVRSRVCESFKTMKICSGELESDNLHIFFVLALEASADAKSEHLF